MTDKPTPKEMDDLFVEETGFDPDDFPSAIFGFARAVLEKWGQPAVAGEPDFYTACAWHEGGGVGEWIAMPGYSNETEHGVKHLVLKAARNEGYKGTADGRLLELGWEIRPVFLTPQPTQAQAVAREPLSHAQAKALVLKYGNDPLNLVFQVELAHGIKGGQHGTE